MPTRTVLPEWRSTRINARYLPALRLAEMVLQNQSVEPGPDGTPVAAFVVSMPQVFEDFVTVALRDALAASAGEAIAQHDMLLAKHDQIPMRPDLVYEVNGRPTGFMSWSPCRW